MTPATTGCPAPGSAAPVGLLWTPGYWGWNDGVYAWNAGYWGPHIGFYGGINYGFGYGGVGFVGGEWRGGAFFYNTAVMRVNTTQITNVYVNRTVIVNNESHVAFNGGEGGVAARPTAQRRSLFPRKTYSSGRGAGSAATCRQPEQGLFASNNHGAPAVAATAKPGVFSGAGVVRAKSAGAPYHAPAMSPKEARASAPAASIRRPRKPRRKQRPPSRPPLRREGQRFQQAAARRPQVRRSRLRPNETHSAKPSAESSRASTPRGNRKLKRPMNRMLRAKRVSRRRTVLRKKALRNRATAPHRSPKASRQNLRRVPRKKAAPKPSHSVAPKPESKPAEPKESARTEPAPKPSHSAAPKPESKPVAPKASAPKESAPKPSHSAPAPKPQKASPAPKPESKPKMR